MRTYYTIGLPSNAFEMMSCTSIATPMAIIAVNASPDKFRNFANKIAIRVIVTSLIQSSIVVRNLVFHTIISQRFMQTGNGFQYIKLNFFIAAFCSNHNDI